MKELIVITDPGKALDDEEMLVLLTHLRGLGLVRPLAVICNLMPARTRARLARGSLALLGAADIPVGAGSPVVGLPVQQEAELLSIAYLAPDSQVHDGKTLLVEALEASGDKGVTLLLASALTDAAALLHSQEKLFLQKVAQVVVMGGVVHLGDTVALDSEGFMTPDSAVNNHYDRQAAQFLYRKLQELGVPMVVLSRHATYRSKLPRTLYHKLSATGHPIGKRLGEGFEQFISDFWQAVNSAPGDLAHDALPARWNRDNFLKTFCDGQGHDRLASESIFDLVKFTVLADPMALLAAVPELRARFYEPAVIAVRGVDHLVIGSSPAVSGVKDRAGLASFLSEGLEKTLLASQALSPALSPVATPV